MNTRWRCSSSGLTPLVQAFMSRHLRVIECDAFKEGLCVTYRWIHRVFFRLFDPGWSGVWCVSCFWLTNEAALRYPAVCHICLFLPSVRALSLNGIWFVSLNKFGTILKMLRVIVESASGIPKKKLGNPDPITTIVFRGEKYYWLLLYFSWKASLLFTSLW